MLTYLKVLTALIFLLPTYALAVDIYKYKDENGAWVFGDKQPVVESEKLNVKFTKKKKDIAPEMFAEVREGVEALKIINPYYAPVEIIVQSEVFDKGLIRTVIDANATATLYEGGEDFSDAVMYWMLGDPKAEHDGTAYQTPSASHVKHQITQSFNGRFSHNSEPNLYAVDFAMDIGTYIVAARGGVVIYVKDDYYYSGTKEYFADKANVVEVLHEDGTYATYAHILGGTASVMPGDVVQAGMKVARSGSSGFATGPHLHFVVHKNGGMKTVSVPFEFIDKKGKRFSPVAGEYIGGNR
ncbi:MAG: M23 family metallopeptidase [Thiotrichales bacterium]|nr:M23 family metallopeptidase [Thiotrichales bacterium]